MLSVQSVLRGSSDLRVGRKMAIYKLFFSVQGTGGSPTGPDPENRVGDQDIGSPVSFGLQVSRGIVVQEKHPLGDLSAAFFLQSVL